MIWVDYLLIGVIALSAVIGLMRGLVREVLSLATWVLAFWVAWTFFRELAPHLVPWISTPSIRLGVAFLALFLLVLILGGLVNYLVATMVDKTGLSGTDSLFGMLFGLARGGVLVAILVLLAGLTPLPNDPWWPESALIGRFEALADWLIGLLPPDVAEHFRFA
jgi:membrane protein required for colicin V production